MADGSVKIDITADDSDIKKKLDGVDDSAEGASDGLDKLGDSVEDAGKDFDAADVTVGAFIANGLTSLVGKIGEAVSSIVALADETREYREDMAKLDAAFTTAGHSTDTAQKAYDEFYKILGESDRTVEAINHLAEFTKKEEDLAQWSTICAGVTAKFGDSLPIEGLTEAANETAKVGAVTGPLADALNWAGISEDEFNKKLEKCNSEQERATLITSTLNSEYSAAAEEYNKLTAETQAARDATNNMEQAQAALGAAIEPVTTAWTNMKANALQWFADTGFPALMKGWGWIKDNLPTVTTLVAGLTVAMVAYKIAKLAAIAAENGMTLAQYSATVAQNALNASMLANPISLIILAITALVAAFIHLFRNCEGFRSFWIGLWDGIKSAAKAVSDWFKTAWEDTLNWFEEAVTKITEFFSEAWEGIKNVFNNSIIGSYFKSIWEIIKGIFAVVKAVLSGNWSDAWAAIKGIVSTWVGFFSEIWGKIKAVFSVVGSWFSGIFKQAKDGIVSVFSDIGATFSEIKENIVGAFSNIKDKFLTIGKNIVEGIKNGIKNAWNNMVSWFKGLFGDLVGIAKKILGIESPSKVFRDEVGAMIPAGLEVGVESNIGSVKNKIAEDMQGLTEQAKAAVMFENSRMAQGVGFRDIGISEVAQAVGMQTAGINSLASEYRNNTSRNVEIPLVLDGRELGRAFVDLGTTETGRRGVSLALT